MTRKNFTLPLFGIGILIVALACNLSSAPPATLVPRPTITPAPTLGYATLSPSDFPTQVAGVPSTDFQLLNLINQVESDRLIVSVDTMQNLTTRHVFSGGFDRSGYGVGGAYRFVRGEFDRIAQQTGNLIVFENEFTATYEGQSARVSNIAAVINGTEIGAGVILIGAHYDTRTTDLADITGFAPGANDNGSGIAALLETARILSQRPHRSTIIFVAFCAEEVGRQGSLAFVNDYIRARNIPLTAMFNIDTVGSDTGTNGLVNDRQVSLYSSGPNESPSRQLARAIDFITFNYMNGMGVVVTDQEDREARYGDHRSFAEAGYPAVRFTETAEEPNRTNGPADTIDDVQADYLAKVTQTILTVVTALADGPRPPKTVHLRDNGNGTRRLIWEPVPDATGYIVALRRPNSLIYDQQFPINDSFVDWDKFIPTEFAGVAVAAKDANGLLGPLSEEYLITQ